MILERTIIDFNKVDWGSLGLDSIGFQGTVKGGN